MIHHFVVFHIQYLLELLRVKSLYVISVLLLISYTSLIEMRRRTKMEKYVNFVYDGGVFASDFSQHCMFEGSLFQKGSFFCVRSCEAR